MGWEGVMASKGRWYGQSDSIDSGGPRGVDIVFGCLQSLWVVLSLP